MQSLYGAIANTNKKEIMAISVDKVYQKVLALANKEQRGYITPQEFNLFADHAQMNIFEQYFYDLNQRQRTPGNDQEYADLASNIEEKISMFEIHAASVGFNSEGEISLSTIEDFYRLGNVSVLYGGSSKYETAELIKLSDIDKYQSSPLAIWTKKRPVYSKYSSTADSNVIKIYPAPESTASSSDTVLVNYIRKPSNPNWTYLISGSKNAMYNPSGGVVDFELHSSEENDLVLKILQLAGISIKDLQLTGAAAQQEMTVLQQEKQ
jgi:stage V sporulation protein SpoVS